MGIGQQLENSLRQLEFASGIAGIVTGNNKRNRKTDTPENTFAVSAVFKIDFLTDVCRVIFSITGVLALGVCAAVIAPYEIMNQLGAPGHMLLAFGAFMIGGLAGQLSGYLAGSSTPLLTELAIGMVAGPVDGIGKGLSDVYKVIKNKNTRNLFFNHKNLDDVVTSVGTAVSSCIVSLVFTLEHLIKFLGYVSCALGNMICINVKDSSTRFGQSADSFVKIFTNLTAAITHPILNLLMARNANDADNFDTQYVNLLKT